MESFLFCFCFRQISKIDTLSKYGLLLYAKLIFRLHFLPRLFVLKTIFQSLFKNIRKMILVKHRNFSHMIILELDRYHIFSGTHGLKTCMEAHHFLPLLRFKYAAMLQSRVRNPLLPNQCQSPLRMTSSKMSQ